GGYYNVVTPQYGAKWTIQSVAAVIFLMSNGSRGLTMAPPIARRILLTGLVALGLAGCASSEGFLTPVPSDADAPGTSHVEMVVATTRARAEQPAFLFGGSRAPEASFADMVVSIPPDANRKIGEVQLPQQPPGNPETDFVTLK